MVTDWSRDFVHAFRRLRRSPALTVAVLTLALGIGVGSAIFSAVHAVLLRPFPYPDPERLAVVSISWPTGRFWLSARRRSRKRTCSLRRRTFRISTTATQRAQRFSSPG